MKAKLLTIVTSAIVSGMLSAWGTSFAMHGYIGSLTLEQQEQSGRILRSIAANQIAPLVGFFSAISAGASVALALKKFATAQPRTFEEWAKQRLRDPELSPSESEEIIARLSATNHKTF